MGGPSRRGGGGDGGTFEKEGHRYGPLTEFSGSCQWGSRVRFRRLCEIMDGLCCMQNHSLFSSYIYDFAGSSY